MTNEAKLGGCIRRSRAILRAAFRTFRQNPRLAWFPVLTALGMLALLAFGAAIALVGTAIAGESIAELGPAWALIAEPNPDRDTTITRALSVGGFTLYVGNTLLMVAMGVATTHACLEALAGRPWTVRESLRVASQRRGAIATFALIQATVGHLLGWSRTRGRNGKRRRPGMLSRLVRVAWWAATYLVLPVIARENRGGIGAIKRSATLLRQTWGETLVARLALGWLLFPVVIVGAVPAIVCLAVGVRQPTILAATVLIPLMGFGVFRLLLHTLEKIYRAALYSYATEGVVPDAFAGGELDEIWEVPNHPGGPIDVDCYEPSDTASTDDAPGDTDEAGPTDGPGDHGDGVNAAASSPNDDGDGSASDGA